MKNRFGFLTFLFVSSTCIGQNEREVNQVFLQTLPKGNFELTTAQLTKLQTIATQCPLAGGVAVFRARAMLGMVGDSTFYDDDAACQLTAGRGTTSGNQIQTESKIRIYPNPANDKVTLVLPENMRSNQDGQVIFNNLFGMEVFSMTISGESLSTQLDMSELPAGVYLGKVYLNGKYYHLEKLILVK
jgi:Secretion system C-terminal sorting domain